MPHVPFFAWAELGVVVAVIWLLSLVERHIVRPSVEDERYGDQPAAAPPEFP
jgi:hypothetical protein